MLSRLPMLGYQSVDPKWKPAVFCLCSDMFHHWETMSSLPQNNNPYFYQQLQFCNILGICNWFSYISSISTTTTINNMNTNATNTVNCSSSIHGEKSTTISAKPSTKYWIKSRVADVIRRIERPWSILQL